MNGRMVVIKYSLEIVPFYGRFEAVPKERERLLSSVKQRYVVMEWWLVESGESEGARRECFITEWGTRRGTVKQQEHRHMSHFRFPPTLPLKSRLDSTLT